jgi:hypothetical protein
MHSLFPLTAAGLSTLLAYNVSPSTTFFNQALALAGWGALVWALALAPRQVRWASVGPVLAALALVALGAVLPGGAGAQDFSLVAGAVGLCAAAAVLLRSGQAAAAGPLALPVARAFFGAWVLVGVLHAAVALVQVFAPVLADGDWIASSSVAGRAVGNLRQPNHLSSLMLWAAIALVAWLELRREMQTSGEREEQHEEHLNGHREGHGEDQRADDGLAVAQGAGRAFNALRSPRGVLVLAVVVMALFIWAVVLTASRTGLVGVVLLALWGLADRRLSRPARWLLLATPLMYAAAWGGMAWWAQLSAHTFGGQQRLAEGDVSGSRLRIWADALQLIAAHPWAGVGWGNFNFAWSLTPFPQRHTAFFDHTHNLPLQLAVELGLPLALLICGLLLWALVQAGRRAWVAPGAASAAGRSALMMVLLIGLHSLLEYPLWYAYFLLPTAFAWGLALGLPGGAGAPQASGPPALEATVAAKGLQAPWLRAGAGVLCVAGALLALFDYLRVAEIFAARRGAAPLEQRIEAGKHSLFFAHHAHYAAATVSDTPAQVLASFDIATHHLLDTRLMMAWAQAYAQAGDLERARHLAQRLREFRNPASAEFLAECDKARAQGLAASALPFQCTPPARPLTWQDFLAQRPGAQSVAEAR